jgi:AraC-like DNA-binding protein
VDVLTSLLDGPRARGAFLLKALLEPPWSVRIQDEAPLSLVAVVRGGAVVTLSGGGAPVTLAAGQVAVLAGADPYVFADAPDTPVQVVIHPGDVCTTPTGEPMSDAYDLGVRTWGNSATGSTVMLIGTYHLDTEVSRQLLRALPPLAVTSADSPLVSLLETEISRDDPGQEAVLDRLLDLLLIAALRAWFARPDATAPAGYRAHADPVVGRALRLIQHNPAQQWTVATLAAQVGVSRAALARRFTALVGESPMAHLTSWRLTLAADLLREPDATIGAVARQVGYGSSFALSTAFKRVHGRSPREYRAGELSVGSRAGASAADGAVRR